MHTINGVPIVKMVWLAAKNSWADKVIVAWPERFPELDENNVLGRFKILNKEFNPKHIIRLTADCPLITSRDINEAILVYNKSKKPYYNNRQDGKDVQIFKASLLDDPKFTHTEHVINDVPNKGGLSVDTELDIALVRKIAK